MKLELYTVSNSPSRVEKSEGFSPNSFDRVQKSEGFSPNSFDRVLLDAPCSALGLRPRLFAGEVVARVRKSNIIGNGRPKFYCVGMHRDAWQCVVQLEFNSKQRGMVEQDSCSQIQIVGTRPCWVKCTINPGENEALVRYALDTYKFLSLAVQHPKIGGPGPVGGCELSD